MEIIDAYRNLLGTHWEPMDNLHVFTIKKGGRGRGVKMKYHTPFKRELKKSKDHEVYSCLNPPLPLGPQRLPLKAMDMDLQSVFN